jgi:peptidoglycan hydrolase-like protein with peptidoglycan-binding domain
MADPIIKLGSTGEAVKKAQRVLVCRYYLWGPDQVDGIFGFVTLNAVVNYQRDRSAGEWYAYSYPLVVDGIVGPATWFRLDPPQVKNGSSGNAVRLLQESLRAYGFPPYDPGPIDAVFGPLTESAVRAFQADYTDCDWAPLAVDGIVGPKTWGALYS